MPTASSITVLPRALQLISGERTKENLFNAFRSLNPGITASNRMPIISDVAVNYSTCATPRRVIFIIPDSARRRFRHRHDAGRRRNVGGNP